MDLQTIFKKTKLPARTLRYVIDQRLLPGLRVKKVQDEVGKPRNFSEVSGFAIACAASLLEGGVKRKTVIHFLDAIASTPIKLGKHLPEQSIIENAMLPKQPFVAILGDNTNIRVKSNTYDSGWRQPKTAAPLEKSYQPRVQISIDLAELRTQISGK